MKNNNLRLIWIGILVIGTNSAFAQLPAVGRSGQNMNIGHFYGKIIDNANKPIEAVSVELIQSKMDSVLKKRKDVVIAGMFTNKKGEFSLENLPVLSTFKLRISAIGYTAIEEKVFFEINMNALSNGDYTALANGVDKDLGNIQLQPNVQQLQDVTVTTEKPLVTMTIDRKIFNVEKNLTSVGGTAQDVMKNVPGVNVDIDGNVTMRNGTPQIFIDGRPTTMTLDQVPADDIESVEIITNPSAKFDASGGGAGILNIVLKKNTKPGYNGNLRASIDSRGKPLIGGNLNVKEGKINFFASGTAALRKSITTQTTTRTGFSDTSTTHLSQNDQPVNDGYFAFLRAGADYFIDNRNTLSLAGNIARGHFTTTDIINSSSDTEFISLPADSSLGIRNINTAADFYNYAATLSYKHNYATANKDLTADVNYSYGRNNSLSNYGNQYYDTQNNPEGPTEYERATTAGSSKFLTAQTDYENPITAKMKIELGARAALRSFSSNSYTYYDSSGQYINIPLLNNNYTFNDQVYAAYGTFSQQINKFSYLAGLRVESSKYSGTLIDSITEPSFGNQYPFSLFPSLFGTYKITDKQSIQANFSRKINRPGFFQLIPFINFSDSLNLTKGNPDLVPEFTNVYELSYENEFSKKHTLLATAYFHNTNNLITRDEYPISNPNPAQTDSVLITSYANASKGYTYGLELIGKDNILSWWDVTTDLNFYNSAINAGNLIGGINNSEFSWFGKLSNNFKLPKNFSIQLNSAYNAKTLIPQNTGGGMANSMYGSQQLPTANGYVYAHYDVDIALKKDFLKNNAASLVLQVSDIFRSNTYGIHSESPYFIQDNYRLRDPQLIRLNFNWRFGKADASLFKRKDLKNEQENIQSGLQNVTPQ
jgi:outer membrane receptor protein involved in Fe transport